MQLRLEKLGVIRACKGGTNARYTPLGGDITRLERGRSSGVEHNLAKVGVVSSNLIARSNFSKINDCGLACPRAQ